MLVCISKFKISQYQQIPFICRTLKWMVGGGWVSRTLKGYHQDLSRQSAVRLKILTLIKDYWSTGSSSKTLYRLIEMMFASRVDRMRKILKMMMMLRRLRGWFTIVVGDRGRRQVSWVVLCLDRFSSSGGWQQLSLVSLALSPRSECFQQRFNTLLEKKKIMF